MFDDYYPSKIVYQYIRHDSQMDKLSVYILYLVIFLLLRHRNEISNLYREPSIDASYQVSIHLAKRFQRRRFFLEINQSETRIACDGHVC